MENKLDNLSKRGKKGGTKFPNYSLKQIEPCLKDLLSKTHAKTITIEQLNAGVFKMNAKSPDGKVKYSSLKQFGLADGEYSKITSTDLSSQIVLASEDERSVFLRQSLLKVPTFKNVYETFQDSSVQKSKIKGYSVSNLKIHIDSSEKFLKSFLDSCEVAKMCSVNADEVSFISGKGIITKSEEDENSNEEILDNEEDEMLDDSDDDPEIEENSFKPAFKNNQQQSNKPNIDLKIDPSLDADKLEKQLKVLRKYGLI